MTTQTLPRPAAFDLTAPDYASVAVSKHLLRGPFAQTCGTHDEFVAVCMGLFAAGASFAVAPARRYTTDNTPKVNVLFVRFCEACGVTVSDGRASVRLTTKTLDFLKRMSEERWFWPAVYGPPRFTTTDNDALAFEDLTERRAEFTPEGLVLCRACHNAVEKVASARVRRNNPWLFDRLAEVVNDARNTLLELASTAETVYKSMETMAADGLPASRFNAGADFLDNFQRRVANFYTGNFDHYKEEVFAEAVRVRMGLKFRDPLTVAEVNQSKEAAR